MLGSLKCDCAEQLELALQMIQNEPPGIVIYLQQEGRGIGLANKIAAYSLQARGGGARWGRGAAPRLVWGTLVWGPRLDWGADLQPVQPGRAHGVPSNHAHHNTPCTGSCPQEQGLGTVHGGSNKGCAPATPPYCSRMVLEVEPNLNGHAT